MLDLMGEVLPCRLLLRPPLVERKDLIVALEDLLLHSSSLLACSKGLGVVNVALGLAEGDGCNF